MRRTEGEWLGGGVCVGSRKEDFMDRRDFLQLITQRHTGWVEKKEGDGGMLMSWPPSRPTKSEFHIPLPHPPLTAAYAVSREAASSCSSQGDRGRGFEEHL